MTAPPRAGRTPGCRTPRTGERQLVDVAGAQILPGERGGQPFLPTPEEALHRSQAGHRSAAAPWVLAVAEAVVQGGVADTEPIALALRPGVPVEQTHTGQGAYALVF